VEKFNLLTTSNKKAFMLCILYTASIKTLFPLKSNQLPHLPAPAPGLNCDKDFNAKLFLPHTQYVIAVKPDLHPISA
jgi:hypothetical protein